MRTLFNEFISILNVVSVKENASFIQGAVAPDTCVLPQLAIAALKSSQS
jgi:hypothetical protein